MPWLRSKREVVQQDGGIWRFLTRRGWTQPARSPDLNVNDLGLLRISQVKGVGDELVIDRRVDGDYLRGVRR